MARRPSWRLLVLAGLALSMAVPVEAQTDRDPYYDFLNGLRLKRQGDAKGALEALERAAAGAPDSASVQAEIAEYFVWQRRSDEAEKAARAALAIDADAVIAHRVLGLLLAGTPARTKEAVAHLERVAASPTGATDIQVQFTLGRAYLLTGATDKAIESLSRLVEDQPYLSQARDMLAQALMTAGRDDEAIDVLEPVADDDPRLAIRLAQLYEQAGRRRQAAEAYGRAAGLNPRNRDLQMRYVSSLLATNTRSDAEKALEELVSVLERDPRDTAALYLQSQAHRSVGNPDAAVRAARTILEINPRDISGAYALAQALGQARRYDDLIAEVEPLVTAAAARGDETASLLMYLSAAYQSLGRHDQAIGALERAKAGGAESAALDTYIVQAYLAAGRYAQAADLAASAGRAHPDDPRFVELQASALFRSGAQPRALTLLEAALKAHPDRLERHLQLAQFYGEAGRVDDGLQVLERAATRFPDSDLPLFQRGALLAEAERIGEAEQAFSRLIEREPEHADALNYLGYMLADRGERLDEAVALIRRALAVDENNPAYLDSLGWAYYKQGRFQEAEQYLMRAAGAMAQNSVVQDHYGDVLARLGRYRDATEAWTRALNGDGEDVDRAAIEAKIRDARNRQ
ncbi:MAG: tetratricopeptide repeat protein [Acidimicrobiia bacterium]|nr:tetratricopeptide repeat protein [Acidimicrobiia bacterium]